MEKVLKLILFRLLGSENFKKISIKIKDESNFYKKITLEAPNELIGIIIGKNGKFIRSLRLILNASNDKNYKKVLIDVVPKEE